MHDHVEFTAAADIVAQPYGDDGHLVSRQIALSTSADTPDEFIWQVAATEIRQPGPLPTYDNTDCILMLTDGGPLRLVDDESGNAKELREGARLYFASEVPYQAELPAGPVRGFSMMFARKRAHGCVDARTSPLRLPLRPGETIFYGLEGRFEIDLPARLGGAREVGPGDVLRLTLDYVPATLLGLKPLTPRARLIDARINLYPEAM